MSASQRIVLIGDKVEEIVASRIEAIAQQLGVTHRAVIDTYLLSDCVATLAESIAAAYTMRHEAVDATEPETLNSAEAGRVIAALGMVMKLAIDQVLSHLPSASRRDDRHIGS